MIHRLLILIPLLSLTLLSNARIEAIDSDYTIKLATGDFNPGTLREVPQTATGLMGRHILVQFEGPISDAQKRQLAQAGLDLLDYIPSFCYTARQNEQITQELMLEHQIHWFGPLQSEHKLSPLITKVGIGEWARRGGDRVQFAIVLHPDEDVPSWARRFERDFGADIIGSVSSSGIIDLIMDEMMYFRLSDLDAVQWIEPALPEPEVDNNKARVHTGAEELQNLPWGLTGAGVVVAEWDGGRADGSHPDLGLRRIHPLDGSDYADHATHVAGTILGNGESMNGLYRGMAPEAELLTQLWWGNSSEIMNEYTVAINSWGAKISSNSWGYGVGDPATQSACENTLGNYYSVNRTIDDVVRGDAGDQISICWSAGNQRGGASKYCGSIGWTYNTVGAIASAKNIITVGAVASSNDAMTSFSSWGPTDDGRIKPDVVGPGYQLTSCKVGGGYTTMSGTSMSCPAVAGTIALLQELWNNKADSLNLLSSSMKGILINTAVDLGGRGPDFEFGHGKVDGVAAARKLAIGPPSFVQGELETGEVDVYDLTLSGTVDRIKVTLVWDDPGGTVSSSMALKNDLDLVLVDPFENEKLPWRLNPSKPSIQASRGADHVNNVETVEIDNPPAGLWKAVVSGYNIPEGPQTYSLVFSPDSINTPGNFVAIGAYAGSDIQADPGTSATAEFWVSNVGAAEDSIHVSIADDALWIQSTVDTVVVISPHDSVYFAIEADVPEGSMVGDQTNVSCDVASMSSPHARDQAVVTVSAAPVYELEVSAPPEDTVGSPDTYYFDVQITNIGNGPDEVAVRPLDEMDWPFTPWLHTVSLQPGGDSVVTFSVSIPAEAAHESVNTVTISANSSGEFEAITTLNLVVSNSVFPPTLILPAPILYSQERVQIFEWTSDTASSFTLLLADDEEMTEIVRVYSGILDTFFTMPQEDSLLDGAYFWAVRRLLGSDSSSLQLSPHQLVVDNIPPANVVADSQANSKFINNKLFTLELVTVGGKDPNTLSPEFSLIQLGPDSALETGSVDYDSITGLTYTQADTISDGRWYWRAQRFDLAGNYSDFSEMATFVLDTEAPVVPSLLLPADDDMIDGDSVVIVWGTDAPAAHEESPERYYLHISNRADFGDFNTFQGYVYDTSKIIPTSLLEMGETYYWRARAFDSAGFSSEYSLPFSFGFQTFLCGDVDGSGTGPDLGDLTFLIAYLFIDGPEPNPLEVGQLDGDELIDLGDLTYLIAYLFLDGDPPICD